MGVDRGEDNIIWASECGLGVLSGPRRSDGEISLSVLGKVNVKEELSWPVGVPPVKKQYLDGN